jgi:uncharacterized membrane protein
MNPIHAHLLVNHLPIVGAIISFGVILFGIILKNDTVKKTGLFINIFSSISAFLAHITGEKAEHLAEEIEGISHSAIHEHEHQAEPFGQLMIGLGILAIIILILYRMKPKLANLLVFISALGLAVSCFLAQRAGTSGGEIRHPEINTTTTSTSNHDEHDD